MTGNLPKLIVQPWGRALLLGLLALTRSVAAQEVIAPPPSLPATPAAMQPVEAANPLTVIPPGGIGPGAAQSGSPFEYGAVTLRPHAFYRFLYGNGIQSSPGSSRSTIVQTVAPGLLVDLGTHWTLDYTPTLTFYSSGQFHDTLEHAVRLIGGTVYGDWKLGLSQGYTHSDQPQVETAQQTSEDQYSTSLSASYQFGGHLSVDLGAEQSLSDVGNVTNVVGQTTNSREWSTMDWLNYAFWPRLDAGLGVGVGYTDVDTGPDSMAEQYQARVRWRATDKISFQGHGGIEDRQFLGSGTGDLINPVFGVEVQYLPFPTTALSLNATRTVNTSLFQDQITENTDFTGNLTQRLLTKLYLSVGGGYHLIRYVATVNQGSAGRRDEGYSFDTRLSAPFLKRGTVSAMYELSRNDSNRPGLGYTSHQVGFEIGYRY